MKTKMNIMQTSVLAVIVAAATAPNVMADQARAKMDKCYTGEVVSVDTTEDTVAVKGWLWSTRHFNLGGGCQYLMVGKDNATMADLRPGEKVTIHYQVAHGVPIANRIEQEPMRFKGMITAIDPNNHTLTLHQSGLDKEMVIAEACSVQLRGSKAGTLGDIRPGDHVTVTYELPGGTPTARDIAQTTIEFTGRLTAIDLEQKTVKAKGVADTLKFNVGNNCAIVLNGRTDGKLSDLKPNDKLVFNYENIKGVNVVSRIAPVPAENSPQPSYTSTPVYPYPTGF